MALLVRVMGFLAGWHASLTDLDCIMRVVEANFRHKSVQILGRFESTSLSLKAYTVPVERFSDTIVRAIMATDKTVYIPGTYQPNLYEIADVQYSINGGMQLPFYVPFNSPVQTDFFYLPQMPYDLTEGIYAGQKSPGGSSIILWRYFFKKGEQFLKQKLRRVHLVDVVILLKDEAYTYYLNDPQDCWMDAKTIHKVATCSNISNIFPQKSVKNFNNCPIILRSSKDEKYCYPYIELPRYFFQGKVPVHNWNYRFPETQTLSAIAEVLNLQFAYHTHEQWKKKWFKLVGLRSMAQYGSMMDAEYTKKIDLRLMKRENRTVEADDFYLLEHSLPDLLPFWEHFVDIEFNCIARHSEVAIADHDMGIDTTHPFATDSLRWSVPAPYPAPEYFGLVRCLHKTVWAFIIFSVVSYSLALGAKKKIPYLSQFLRTLATISQQGVPNIDHWDILLIFYALHVVTFYQASLLDNLFYKRMTQDYKSVDEALANNGELLETFQAYLYFYRDGKRHILDRYFNKENLGMYENDTITAENFKEELGNAAWYCRKQENCSQLDTLLYQAIPEYSKKKILPEVVSEIQFQFLMPIGHPLLPGVNKVIRSITESGLSQSWVAAQYHRMRIALKYPDNRTQEKLRVSQLLSIFHLLAVLLILSSIVFLSEVIIFNIKLRIRLVLFQVLRSVNHFVTLNADDGSLKFHIL